MRYYPGKSFSKSTNSTYLEIGLVFILIVFIFSLYVFIGDTAIKKIKTIKLISQIHQVRKAVNRYLLDTGNFPKTCSLTCTQATDSLANNIGVSGWKGPYLAMWNLSHPWGGHIGFLADKDLDGDGKIDYAILLDDDRPGKKNGDNQGKIPRSVLIKIDQSLDDGNLATGIIQGDTEGFPNFKTEKGELIIKFFR